MKQYAASVGSQDGSRPDREAELAQMFPTTKTKIKSPTIVQDIKGRILAWILPDLLPSEVVVSRHRFINARETD